MRRGELWIVVPVAFPKPRPAVIMSVDAWNDHALDVVVVPLTTKPGPSRPVVRHPRLDRESFAQCGAVGALAQTQVKERIGRVDHHTLAAIGSELQRLLGLG